MCQWQVSLFGSRRQRHPSCASQLFSISKGRANRRDNDTCTVVPWLRCISWRRYPEFNGRETVLAGHNNASYLNKHNACSRAGGFLSLSNHAQHTPNNGAILNVAQIIKNVVLSAAEAELSALYIVTKECVYICLILEEMGHRQPATPLQTDNTKGESVINSNNQPRRTKAMDMRFHWLWDHARHCSNSASTGAQANWTWWTTSQSIILPFAIATCNESFWQQRQPLTKQGENCSIQEQIMNT